MLGDLETTMPVPAISATTRSSIGAIELVAARLAVAATSPNHRVTMVEARRVPPARLLVSYMAVDGHGSSIIGFL